MLQKKLAQNLNSIGVWVARKKVTNDFIDTVNLDPLGHTEMIQLGCHLRHKFREQGFVTELTKKVLDYGKDEIGLTEIF